jgi:KTSC domain-containing protein
MDTVGQLQDLVNGPAPSTQPAATPTPAQISETNGIPWGSGGQGPIELRGKMIPRSAVYPGAPLPQNPGTFPGASYPESPSPQVLQGNALARGAQSGQPLPGAALGQIPSTQTQAAPQPMQPAPELTPVPIGNLPQPKGNPYAGPRTPAVMDPVTSGQISKIGYHPDSQTAVIQFANGRVYQYSGVPQEMYDNMKNAESVGSFFAQNIKGRYSTAFRGSVPQLKGAKAAQALLNQSSSLAQRIPTSGTTAGSPPAMENQ